MIHSFDFDTSAPRPRVTDEMLIKSLKVFARRRNFEYFSCRDYDAWDAKIACVSTILRRFGSWNNALKQAGITKLGKQRTHKPKLLIEHLQNCWKDLGFRPSSEQVEKYSKRLGVAISRKPYRRFWGSVLNACKQIEAFHNGLITEEELYYYAQKKQKKRDAIPPSLRYDVLKRDNNTCVKCGANPRKHKGVRLEVDHIIPAAKGGRTTLENLQTLCRKCNQGKRDKEN